MKIHRQFDGKRRVFSRSTARTLHNMFHVSEALFNFRLFFFYILFPTFYCLFVMRFIVVLRDSTIVCKNFKDFLKLESNWLGLKLPGRIAVLVGTFCIKK